MKILIAPDKFKGSLAAPEVARAIRKGWLSARPGDAVEILPIADGGEGFAEVIAQTLGAEWVEMTARDPLGRRVSCHYAWHEPEKLAILETSQACGLWRLQPDELDPLQANTFGVGEMIRHATKRGAAKIVAGLGGSATTDGGAGMAVALGYGFSSKDGDILEPIPANLSSLVRIDASQTLDLPEIVAASDVTNPLLGPQGTAAIFSPQKGATPEIARELERHLENFANVITPSLGVDFRDTPGAGAAGGLGYGLLTFCGATLQSGFDLVAELLRLEDHIQAADLVITGEGRLDSQTLSGKGPAGVAQLAQKWGKPVIAFAGSTNADAVQSGLFSDTYALLDIAPSLEASMKNPAHWLEKAAGMAGGNVKRGA